eukprot:scaffold31278_cov74-Phaeocystis_antarctica.AAC.10
MSRLFRSRATLFPSFRRLEVSHVEGPTPPGPWLAAVGHSPQARAVRRSAALVRCEGRAARRQARCTAWRPEAGTGAGAVLTAALGRFALLRLRKPRHLGLGHLHAARKSGPAAEAEVVLELRRAVTEDAVRFLPRSERDACLTRADRGDGERAAGTGGGEDELVYLLRAEEDVRLEDQPHLDAWGGSLGCRGVQSAGMGLQPEGVRLEYGCSRRTQLARVRRRARRRHAAPRRRRPRRSRLGRLGRGQAWRWPGWSSAAAAVRARLGSSRAPPPTRREDAAKTKRSRRRQPAAAASVWGCGCGCGCGQASGAAGAAAAVGAAPSGCGHRLPPPPPKRRGERHQDPARGGRRGRSRRRRRRALTIRATAARRHARAHGAAVMRGAAR